MKRLAAALLFAALGFAQQPEIKTKVIEVKNVRSDELRRITQAFVPGGRGGVDATPDGKYLIVTGPPESIEAVEAAAKQFDVPPKDIELTFNIISASPQPNSEKLPADLDPVMKQLHSAFVYQGYRLLETTIMRIREGSGGEVSGQLPGKLPNEATIYQIQCRSTRISAGTPNVIRLDNLKIGGKFPITNAKGDITYVDTGINTSVDMKEGQKVVVGKSTMNESAAFLVVSARVLD